MKRHLCILFVLLVGVNTLTSQDWLKYKNTSDQELSKRNYEKALEQANLLIEEIKKIYGENSKQYANNYGQLGKVYYTMGEFEKAGQAYKEQIALIRTASGEDNPIYARAVNNLSVIYQSLGKMNEIEPLLLESIKIKKDILGAKDSSYAKTLNNLAQYYQSVGRYPEAEKLFVETLEIKKQELGVKHESYGLTLYNMGMLYKNIGNSDKALVFLEDAYNTLKNAVGATNPNTLSAMFQLSLSYKEKGIDNAKSKELIAKASNLTNSLIENYNLVNANSAYNLAQVKLSYQDYNAAIDILSKLVPKLKEKQGNGHPLYTSSLRALGIAYWIKGDIAKAYELISETVEISKQLYSETSLNYATSLHNLASLVREMGEVDEAEIFYKKAFDIYLLQIEKYFPYYSEAEKAKFYSLLKERFEMFNCFILTRYKQNPAILGDMYDYHLATKGLMFDYARKLRQNVMSLGDEQLKATYQKWLNHREQLSKAVSMSSIERKQAKIDLDVLENDINNLERELSLKTSSFASKEEILPSWRNIQAKLNDNEAAVEIVRFKYFNKNWADSTIYVALILTKETTSYPKAVVMFNGNNMDKFNLKSHKRLIKSKFPDKKSHEVYWKEIEDALGDKEVIYMAADGVYNVINVSSFERQDGSYVIDNKRINVVNSTSTLLERNATSSTKSDQKTATLFGFPTYKLDADENSVAIKQYKSKEELGMDSTYQEMKIAPLPGTKTEVEMISKMLIDAGWSVTKFMETEANESNMKQVKSPTLLHIATHGYFLESINEEPGARAFGVDAEKAAQNPLLRSGLLLSGASNFLNFDFTSHQNDENGILTAYEATNLDLTNTDIVVLSACETGLGEVMNGEGVYGLQRSFRVAGAKSLIMSLWTVNDEATQELMTTFYDKWAKGDDIKTAFRKAQLAVKEKFEKPYYWGAFVLLGDAE